MHYIVDKRTVLGKSAVFVYGAPGWHRRRMLLELSPSSLLWISLMVRDGAST